MRAPTGQHSVCRELRGQERRRAGSDLFMGNGGDGAAAAAQPPIRTAPRALAAHAGAGSLDAREVAAAHERDARFGGLWDGGSTVRRFSCRRPVVALMWFAADVSYDVLGDADMETVHIAYLSDLASCGRPNANGGATRSLECSRSLARFPSRDFTENILIMTRRW